MVEVDSRDDVFCFFNRCWIESTFRQITDAWAIPCDEFRARLDAAVRLGFIARADWQGLEEYRDKFQG